MNWNCWWIVFLAVVVLGGCGEAKNPDASRKPTVVVATDKDVVADRTKKSSKTDTFPPPADVKPTTEPIGSGGPEAATTGADPGAPETVTHETKVVVPFSKRPLTSNPKKATPPPAEAVETMAAPAEPSAAPKSKSVPVYFGTNRFPRLPPSDDDTLEDYYTSRIGKVQYGTCRVSIPLARNVGDLPTAKGKDRDPTKVFLLQSLTVARTEAEWIGDVASATRNGKADRHDAIVFVHGFNVSFSDAIYRAAQLKEDLQFAGPALAFSWPSRGTVGGYDDDQEAAKNSVEAFETFLRVVLRSSQARKVHVIAHSMGNRVMTAALARIAEKPETDGSPIEEIILAAPDVDAKVFHDEIAPHFVKAGRRRTLYASQGDMALRASYFIHKFAPRLGDAVAHVKGLAIEAVDAKLTDTSLLAHSYYGDEPLVIEDIKAVLNGKSPDDRNLSRVYDNCWCFKLAETSDWWWFLLFAMFVGGLLAGWWIRGFYTRSTPGGGHK